MIHPPGPSRMYPEANQAIADYLNELALEMQRSEDASQVASASLETTAVIETPPEWGRPDEGNPNQPRRPPEYTPPQVGSKYTQRCRCSVIFDAVLMVQPDPVKAHTVLGTARLDAPQCCLPDIHASYCSAVLSNTWQHAVE